MSKATKNPETVHVGILIDESGSMGGNEEAVIRGINDFIKQLRTDQDGARVFATLAKFDLRGNAPVVRYACASVPLDEVTAMGPGDYAPQGSTPLNDAVQGIVRKMSKQVRKRDRALLVILTDGLENASETSTSDIRKLIVDRENAGWRFIYLGANQDAWAESHSRGLGRAGTFANFDATPAGTAAAMHHGAARAIRFREGLADYDASADELPDRISDSGGR